MYSEKFEKVIHGRNILPFFIMYDKKDHIPEYFEQLSEQDKKTYKALQTRINYDRGQKNRARKPEIIREAVGMVDLFTQNDPAKSLVCGYYRFQDKILLNIRQFKILFSCCKSQCNILLKTAGYNPIYGERPKAITLKILFGIEVKEHSKLKQWCFREIPGVERQPQQEVPEQEVQQELTQIEVPTKTPPKSFTVVYSPKNHNPYWPYTVVEAKPNNGTPIVGKQVNLDPYDSYPVNDVEIYFPEEATTSPLPDYDENYCDQYEPSGLLPPLTIDFL